MLARQEANIVCRRCVMKRRRDGGGIVLQVERERERERERVSFTRDNACSR